MRAALTGVRIVDLTTFMSGPFATMALGDLGAEVIKIEQPGEGDASRQIPPHYHAGESLYYVSLNRNKKSITLNLSKEQGRDVFYGLVRTADVVVDNYRPGITDKLKVNYEALREIKRDIICCSISAYGLNGPYGRRPAYDLIIQALSGMMSMTGTEDSGPIRMGAPMGDLAASLWAMGAILTALYHREKTGEGQFIDLSLFESLTSLITYPALYYSHGGEVAQPLGSGHQSIVPFQAFKTKDYYITVVCANEKFWHLFCDTLERADLKDDSRFRTLGDRLKHRDELNVILDGIFSQKTTAEWNEILEKGGVPCAPVNTIDKVFEDPVVKHRKFVKSVDHFGEPLRMFGNPIHLSATPIEEYRTPPKLGADTEEVLSDLLGYSSEEIARLREYDVI